jgi:hypothetical protein
MDTITPPVEPTGNAFGYLADVMAVLEIRRRYTIRLLTNGSRAILRIRRLAVEGSETRHLFLENFKSWAAKAVVHSFMTGSTFTTQPPTHGAWEYLMNLNVPNATGLVDLGLSFDQQKLSLRYQKSRNAPDGSLQVETSTDLTTWNRDGVTDTIVENLDDARLLKLTKRPLNSSDFQAE